ncbi:hypothetical protein [Methylopila sp. 73B]|uniref:hypothetical protein n=1 Tax=Methylopila sp. 73B TaxID=1120792 RepID=UPI0003649E14|nr:hypothetical protein [Methylopila sp. 73B]
MTRPMREHDQAQLLTSGVRQDDIIVLRSRDNPHPEWTKAHGHHDRLRTGMRVSDYVALCPDRTTALAELAFAHRRGIVGFVAGPSR